MNKIRWGIIGPGAIAHNFADALKESYSGELLAIASRTSTRLEEFGNKYNVSKEFRFNDYDQLLDDENIDAVFEEISNYIKSIGLFLVWYKLTKLKNI